jgi:Domain of unknown function (DUF4169)
MVDRPKPPAEPMAEIVNLRRARKARGRDAARESAEAARLQHGRAKSEKSLTDARNEKAARDLDARKRDQDGGEPSDS